MAEEIEKIKKESYEKEEERRRLERKGRGMEEEIKEVRGIIRRMMALILQFI